MPAYHQMGHHTENLVGELQGFSGAVLSPVNATESETAAFVASPAASELDIVFDPQLYRPRSNRGQLPGWAYFPTEVDTADVASATWWGGLHESILATLRRLGVRRLCSPVVVPRSYEMEYYALTRERAFELSAIASADGVHVLHTVLVPMDALVNRERVLELASVLSGPGPEAVYLVLLSDLPPRKEYPDTDMIRGAMRLMLELSRVGIQVTVPCTGSEFILYVGAGASVTTTGKFFNLRRFTLGRFEEPGDGGGQLPYWFEESLLAFVRQSDLVRLRGLGLLSSAGVSNPWGEKILDQLDADPAAPWLGLSWRQYMHWYQDADRRLRSGEVAAGDLLRQADQNWGTLEQAGMFMEERHNQGQWIRPWLRALLEYETDW